MLSTTRRVAPPARRGARCSGTTNKAVRDFRDRGGPFVAHTRSHVTTAPRADRLTLGKQATIARRPRGKKSFYVNVLWAGGGHSHQRTILHLRFPVIQGKYREFSRFRGLSATMDRRKDVYSLAFLIEFPAQPNREIFRRNRELIRRNREFSFGISEPLNRCRPIARFGRLIAEPMAAACITATLESTIL